MEAADDFIATAEERQNDPQWALVEIEIAKAHMLAAAIKTALRLADGQGYHGLAAKAAPAIIGLVGKIAR